MRVKEERKLPLIHQVLVAKYTALFPWRSVHSVDAWLSAGAASVKGAPQWIIR